MTPSSACEVAGGIIAAADENFTDKIPKRSADGGFHLPDVSLWTKWALLSILSYAIPFYKTALKMEEKIEDVAEVLVDDVEKVAIVVEKVATEIASVLPEESVVEYDFVMIEHIAEEMIEVAQKVETFIQKVDQAKEKIEKKLEPYINRGEELIKREFIVEGAVDLVARNKLQM